MDDFTRRHLAAAAEASRDYKTGRGPATAAALDALDRLGARVDAELTDAVARKYYPALFESPTRRPWLPEDD